ncbi:MAG TPA: hypothetical protein VMU45_00695 [Candidatus Eisenbacteria bacterium]|nr:hypothetical protein [Candidatus Eisenbacteria bacterium]
MKKTMIAALASLMLAGLISAASGSTPKTATGTIVIVGEGSSPIPWSLSRDVASDQQPNN